MSQPVVQEGGLGSPAYREGSGAYQEGSGAYQLGNQALSAERAFAVQVSVQWLGRELGVVLAKQAALRYIYTRRVNVCNIVNKLNLTSNP